jgi:hypothetical protein
VADRSRQVLIELIDRARPGEESDIAVGAHQNERLAGDVVRAPGMPVPIDEVVGRFCTVRRNDSHSAHGWAPLGIHGPEGIAMSCAEREQREMWSAKGVEEPNGST